jgi:uncharacterized repeat protein (TIGR01451 family)
LIEVMDNRDGTLSIFGTILDHASPATAPAPGNASAFDAAQLASIGRTFAFNDPENNFSGEGTEADQNVELLVEDPRQADLSLTKSDSSDPARVGKTLTYTLAIRNGGPLRATDIVVTDRLPDTVRFLSASLPGGSCSQASGTVTCQLAALADDATAAVTIKVQPQGRRTIENSASVASAVHDPDTANNSATESTVVR